MSIREVSLTLPQDCQVFGCLYDSTDKRRLGEDMLDVVLPNGLLITAGWYPEGSEQGGYQVSIQRGLDQLIPRIESTAVDDAAQHVQALVGQFIGRNFSVDTNTTLHESPGPFASCP